MALKRLLISLLAVLILALPAAAYGDTVIQARPGLNGVYRSNQPVQINISIANNGPAIEEALLMVRDADLFSGGHLQRMIYQQTVQVPANQHIETSMIIPWELISSGRAKVYLYSKGEEIASDAIQGISVGGEMVAISVGDTPLAKGLPSWLEAHRKHMLTMKYLAPHEIPTNPLALMAANIIMLDGSNIENISPQQAETIRHWVALGGTLILSGGAGAQEGQPFVDISPVLVTGESTLAGNWNGLRNTTDAIPVAVGRLEQGRNKAAYGDTPLVATNIHGRGQVIYSAAGFEHIDAKDTKLWETIFDDRIAVNYDKYQGSMLHASAQLPQLQMPSIKLMIGVWAIYMLVVAPGLYWVLKRKGRRDWAWFCIPAMAVVAAGVMYHSAPFHQLKAPLGNTLAVVEVLDEDVAEIQAEGSYVSPRGEDLLLVDSGPGLVIPSVRYTSGTREGLPVIEYTPDGQLVSFTDIDFWSMRQASTYKVANDFGSIASELELSENKISGTLNNNTKVSLKDCMIVIGEKAIEIGNLELGAQVNIDSDLRHTKAFSWDRDVRERFSIDVNAMVHTVKEVPMRSDNPVPGFAGIYLIAYTEDLTGVMEIEKGDNYFSAVVLQKLPMAFPESGKVSLPPGIISPQIVDYSGGIHHYDDERYMIEGGDVTVEYNLHLPLQQGVLDISSVKLTDLKEYDVHKVSAFNWSDNQWEEIPIGAQLEGDELRKYLSKHQSMQFKISQLDHGRPMPMPMPGLAVEGVVK